MSPLKIHAAMNAGELLVEVLVMDRPLQASEMRNEALLLGRALVRHLPQTTFGFLTAVMLDRCASELKAVMTGEHPHEPMLRGLVQHLRGIKDGLSAVLVGSGSEPARQAALGEIGLALDVLDQWLEDNGNGKVDDQGS